MRLAGTPFGPGARRGETAVPPKVPEGGRHT